ncbi:glycoside hydrolase family 31 protein [Alloacidobacterium dinghuense]|uniref:Glycoside hydrolase family 31 protein n=1 Tax=Alloacidobacterium dinghuense TaxID=2763107 RepID=A0A7G8BLX0_9BACT|nr:TIM-barrel domain-containing protein [Alloacidobacterium dinghuense]QNI33540.1 glycoside hydrolase family 31 protein [Alloacidobacterium dinghuense]
MAADLSRRTLLRNIGASAMTTLLRERLALAPFLSAAGFDPSHTGDPALQLSLTAVGENTLRVTIAAVGVDLEQTFTDGSLSARSWPSPMSQVRTSEAVRSIQWGKRRIQMSIDPLRIAVEDDDGHLRQELRFESGMSQVRFHYGDGPVFGLGEGVHPLDRRGTTDAMRNGQHGEELKVYGARVPIPLLIGASGWGLFFHEPWGSFDLTGETGMFRSGESARGLDIFLMLGDTPAQLMREWAELTGYPHMPPIWALGYQQSHRTLASREEVLKEAKTFREKQLPCDALIYLGTGFCPSGWNTGHGSFVFNDAAFPDPEAMIQQLHADHFKVVLHIVNPPEDLHGKVSDTGSAIEESGDAAAYWRRHLPLVRMGVDGWWPDEGDVLPVASRLARNEMYWEGERQARPNLRPYALHRNGYAGLQRYGWLWSGDIFCTWKTLAAQVMIGINAGLCGISYWGTDTGGFVPTKEFTAELFVRWFQFSAFCPLFRSHGRTWKLRLPWGWNTGDYEPAELEPEYAAEVLPKPNDLHNLDVERICRKYLNTRYQLLPYIYSAVAEGHRTGMPLMRALWLHYPHDQKARTIEDTYLFGDALLVAPVLEPGTRERRIYLPQGAWWDFWTGERVEGGTVVTRNVDLETMPVYAKAGAIVPTGPLKQFALAPSTEPVKLAVYPGADGKCSLYEDDGQSFAYEHEEFTRLELEWSDATRSLSVRAGGGKATRGRKFRVALANGPEQEITFDGREVKIHL